MQFIPLEKDKVIFNPNRIVPFDVETRDGLKGTDFWVSAIAKYQNKKLLPKFADSPEEFVELIKDTRKDSIFFAHNLEFDLRFLLNFAEIKNFLFYGRGILKAMLKFPGLERVFEFRDSYALLPMSQEHLAKSLGTKYQKYFIDWKGKITEQQIRERVKYDVLGLFEILKIANEYYFKTFELNLLRRLTMAQYALCVFRSNFLKKKILNPYFNEDKPLFDLYYYIRSSYYGGRTEVFDLRKFYGAKSYDINSLYPAVMRPNVFPIGKIRHINHPRPEFLEELGISVVDLLIYDQKIPPTPFRLDKVYFPVGLIKRGIYTNQHINYVVDNGYGEVKKIYRTSYFTDGDKLFEEFIDVLYKMRIDKQLEKNLMQVLDKLVMNTSYGKFGQRPETFTYEQMEEISDFLDSKEFYFVGEGKNRDIYCKKVKEKLRHFSLVQIASYITSLSKDLQHRTLKEYEEDMIYTDTDSFVVPKHISMPTGTKLGEMKLEKTFDEFQAFSPKAYLYTMDGKRGFTLKGFKHDKEELEKMTNLQILELVRKIGAEWDKYASVKRLFQPNKNTTIVDKYLGWEKFKRVFPLEYTKRIITGELKTVPYNVQWLVDNYGERKTNTISWEDIF